MTAMLPVTIFLLVNTVWILTGVQSTKLFNLFKAKYPIEAQKRIPDAFSRSRHPEKSIFFFRKESLPLLKSGLELWRPRQRLKLLLLLSAFVPIVGFLIIAWIALPQIKFK
jgi:hypothetical protein